MLKENIKVEGHVGTWYVIDETTWYGKKFFLLEHETFGEDADNVVITERGSLIFEDIVGGITEVRELLNHKYFLENGVLIPKEGRL